MPPKQKFTREEIVAAALEIVRRDGAQALTARELGRELNSSARPIFTVFSGMDEVREHTVQAALELFVQYIDNGLNNENSFRESGKAYISFARRESELFKMLFMTGGDTPATLGEILKAVDTFAAGVVQSAGEDTGLSADKALRLFHHMWVYVHGIAVLHASGACNFTDEELNKMLYEAGLGISSFLKSEGG